MKIGISVTPVYNIQHQPKQIDGIGTYTLNLAQALSEQNVQVKEIYFKGLRETHSPIRTAANFQLAGNPLLSMIPGNTYHFTEKFDLIHITDYLVPRVSKIPVVAFIHDAIMLKKNSWQNTFKCKKKIKSFLLKRLAKNACHYLTCSQSVVQDLIKYWEISPEKISVTHHGLASIWHHRLPKEFTAAVLKKYQLDKPFFLTVGTLQPRKNFEKIITAYYSLPKDVFQNYKLVIVGKEHASLTSPALLEKINQLDKTGKVVWLKYVSFEELRCLYQRASLLLFPSLEEGFGFPILEGFASKTPVITSHFGSMAEIAGESALLIDPYSTDEMRAAILKIVENHDLQKALITAGLTRAQEFTWEKCAKETIAIYQKII